MVSHCRTKHWGTTIPMSALIMFPVLATPLYLLFIGFTSLSTLVSALLKSAVNFGLKSLCGSEIRPPHARSRPCASSALRRASHAPHASNAPLYTSRPFICHPVPYHGVLKLLPRKDPRLLGPCCCLWMGNTMVVGAHWRSQGLVHRLDNITPCASVVFSRTLSLKHPSSFRPLFEQVYRIDAVDFMPLCAQENETPDAVTIRLTIWSTQQKLIGRTPAEVKIRGSERRTVSFVFLNLFELFRSVLIGVTTTPAVAP